MYQGWKPTASIFTVEIVQSQRQSYLRLAVCLQSVRLGAESLETYGHNFFFQLNPCSISPYVTSSLMRGCVCRLQFLLAFDSAVILWSGSRELVTNILLSQFGDFPNLEDQVTVFITPRHWVSFSSPPTSRRTRVEVFEPASTRALKLLIFMAMRKPNPRIIL
jgi:hypothetical protein